MTDNERNKLIQSIANTLSTPVSAEWNDGMTVGPLLPQNGGGSIPSWIMTLLLVLVLVGFPLVMAISGLTAVLSLF
jgi:hypothetical protein